MDARESIIATAFADRSQLPAAADAVHSVIADLDAGKLRVASQVDGDWVVHTWVKQAVLLYFGLAEMRVLEAGPLGVRDLDGVHLDRRDPAAREGVPGGVRVQGEVDDG